MAIHKGKSRIMLFAVLALLIVTFFLLPEPKKIDVDAPKAVEEGSPSLQPAVMKSEGQNPPYAINVEYPKLGGISDTRVVEAVNRDIEARVKVAIDDFKSNVSAPPTDIPESINTLDMRYEAEYLGPKALSLAIIGSAYVAGSAHPSNYIDSWNYDLRNGQRVRLADLFVPNSKYLTVLSDYVTPALIQKLGIKEDDADSKEWAEAGASPKSENYEDFLINKDGIVIVFNAYQVGPGAIGIQKIPVPYAVLDKIADPDGLLASIRAEN